jgi:signal transduction histidine kinase
LTRRELGPTLTGETPREQRLAAAGRVAAGLLHEFRNVLAPITNLAFVLERQADDPARVRELARRLATMAEVRGRVVERLRDFLRQDAERFPDDAVVDIAAAARETVALCATLAAGWPTARVELRCETFEAVPVTGDGEAIRRAVFELALNAMEALRTGGTVLVRVAADGATARVEVSGGGAGVPDGMAELVFDPFISSKEEPDAGLGLSAAWGIARRHGGDLTLGSHPSGVTVATLTLPMWTADSRASDEAPRKQL